MIKKPLIFKLQLYLTQNVKYVVFMNEKIVRVEMTPLYVPFKEYARKAMGESEGGIGMVHPSEEEWLGAEFVIVIRVADLLR